MKVNNNRDSVELSSLSRSKKSDKTNKAEAKEGAESLANAIGPSSTANVEISGEAKSLASANAAARAGGDVDQAKVDRIKAMLNNGTYKPDFGKVADKVVNETLLQDLS